MMSLLKFTEPSATDDGAPASSSQEPGVKKQRRGIKFEGVTVFYFPRSQGFSCVPSQGGSTLGMARTHFHKKKFTLTEHLIEQRRSHRMNQITRATEVSVQQVSIDK